MKNVYFFIIAAICTGCFGSGGNSGGGYCTLGQVQGLGTDGDAYVFQPDPLESSGLSFLSPSSPHLNDYRSLVALDRLLGKGYLSGEYVEVRNGLYCSERFGAFDRYQDFRFGHKDLGFQESMTYYYGDAYQAFLDQLGYRFSSLPVYMIAHCMLEDNAYYTRGRNSQGQLIEKVCLGDSVSTPGASYSDDASVVVHELQHSATLNAYSQVTSLNQMPYDEAGAINEAISDFQALAFLEPQTQNQDSRVFSRWALALYNPQFRSHRGVHRCPEYDSSYPDCSSFGVFSAEDSHVSYRYPDGLGWPYAKYDSSVFGPAYLKRVFEGYAAQEQIHNVSVTFSGALWDVYQGIKANHSGDGQEAFRMMTKMVFETLAVLPHPTAANRSPVTMPGFAQKMKEMSVTLNWSGADQKVLEEAFEERGLLNAPSLGTNWLAVGSGKTETPGLHVIDHPNQLKAWLRKLGLPIDEVTQGIQTGLNSRLDAGEAVLIWFDVKNLSQVTAGAPLLKIHSLDSRLKFLSSTYNPGYVSDTETQVRYLKVNGLDIVQALQASNATFHVPTGNSYFFTNPYYSLSPRTGVWMKADSSLTSGENLTLRVEVLPSNGPSEIVDFSIQIQ